MEPVTAQDSDDGGALLSRLTAAPLPHDAEIAREVAALYPDAPGEMAELIAGVAGSSPYLATLLRGEAEWLPQVWGDDPAAVIGRLIDTQPEGDAAALKTTLRRARRRAALLIALADLGGVWRLMQVTGALTRFADAAVGLALRALVGAEARRGRIPGVSSDDDAGDCAGLVALAMGKMGAHELNYSSDIDLICLFDESRHAADEVQEVRAGLIRVTRRMCALLSDVTGEGYVFRTDLRLRPDPAVTPVCLSMEAAERYYESVGRAWERAAYIKARAAAGDIAAGEAFLGRLAPFVWRRHLDFAAIQDAHDMRLRIRSHRGTGGRIALEGHDMKLGRGGIREIEFFTQTRQLIAGGRDPDLRVRGTLDGLAALAAKGWVPDDAADTLARAYVAHRTIEHRVQMIEDAQTHALPTTGESFDRLARLAGWGDTAAFRADLAGRLEEVDALIESFFAPAAREAPPTVPEDAFSENAREVLSRWRDYPALRSSRAVEIFGRLRPVILGQLARAAEPDDALAQFDGFLKGLPAGVQLFSLFEANPHLVELLCDICATAPGLAAHLARNAGVLDAVIGGDFFAAWPGEDALAEMLERLLAEAGDYEAQLDAARRWAREWRFRTGVHLLRGLIDAPEAARQYSGLAGAVLRALWPVVAANFARRHGPLPGRGAAVLGMGSLGARAMTAASDLDLIVIYDAAGAEGSDGPKPLSVTAYYARLTQALVTALSARMAEGQLYEVDMRLRPSGRQGPVAVSIESFRGYQRDEAWVWEHMALTRARAVAGTPELCDELEAFRVALLAEKGAPGPVRREIAAMRDRIARAVDEARTANPWEPKLGPGRMQDIELVAQGAALVAGADARAADAQLEAGAAAGFLPRDAADALRAAHARLFALNQAGRLVVEGPLDIAALGEGARSFVLRVTGAEDEAALRRQLDEGAHSAARLVAGVAAAGIEEQTDEG